MSRVRLLTALLCFALSAADSKHDFSRHWVLNVEKSNFGKAAKPTRMTLDADHKSGVLHSSQTTYDAQGGQQTTEGNWYEDGKEHPLEQFGPGKSVTKWSGSTLVNDRRSNDGQYQEHITLVLSKDGKTATEKIHVKNPNGENNSTLIWERK